MSADRARHPPEDPVVDRPGRVPVGKAGEPGWLEECGRGNHGANGAGRELELEQALDVPDLEALDDGALPDQVAVGDDVPAADLEDDSAWRRGVIECSDEIPDHILDGDRLRAARDAARRHRHREPTGLACLQSIAVPADRYERFRRRPDWIRDIEQVRLLGYDERFLRTWRSYLASCEAGFAIRVLRDLQVVLTRPGNDALAPGPRRG